MKTALRRRRCGAQHRLYLRTCASRAKSPSFATCFTFLRFSFSIPVSESGGAIVLVKELAFARAARLPSVFLQRALNSQRHSLLKSVPSRVFQTFLLSILPLRPPRSCRREAFGYGYPLSERADMFSFLSSQGSRCFRSGQFNLLLVLASVCLFSFSGSFLRLPRPARAFIRCAPKEHAVAIFGSFPKLRFPPFHASLFFPRLTDDASLDTRERAGSRDGHFLIFL